MSKTREQRRQRRKALTTRIVIFILVLMAIILICKVTGISDMPPQDGTGMVLPGEILGGRP